MAFPPFHWLAGCGGFCSYFMFWLVGLWCSSGCQGKEGENVLCPGWQNSEDPSWLCAELGLGTSNKSLQFEVKEKIFYLKIVTDSFLLWIRHRVETPDPNSWEHWGTMAHSSHVTLWKFKYRSTLTAVPYATSFRVFYCSWRTIFIKIYALDQLWHNIL